MENLPTDKKKIDLNLQAAERSYCNVAPLVPDFLTKINEQNSNTVNSSNKQTHDSTTNPYETDLPKTPKARNAHSSQDNLMKKLVEAHTPESGGGSLGSKSIPSTPGGMSLNTFEQLMKKCDSPIDLIAINKHTKPLPGSQELGLDFSMAKKPNVNANMAAGGMTGGLTIKTPITLNNEPIEVSDDSDETNQPPPPEKKQLHPPLTNAAHLGGQQPQQQQSTHHNSFNMDDMFVANAVPNLSSKPLEAEISNKELKKLKKQVKKSALPNMNALKTDNKVEALTSAAAAGGVGKLAGGADLIPLTSTGLAYSSKNIPYNSLTANANPSFHTHKTDFSNNAVTATAAAPPPSSSNSVFDNLTITAAIPMTSSSANTAFDLQKKRKEHKKLKKLKELKEGKIKKKKDKKDKNKSKERSEKYLMGQAHISAAKEKDKDHITVKEVLPPSAIPTLGVHSSGSEKVKEKDLLKKLKKEKKKEKQRSTLEDHTTQNTTKAVQQQSLLGGNVSAHKDKTALPSASNIHTFDGEPSKKQKLSPGAACFTTTAANEHYETALTVNTTTSALTAPASIIPKLTLKLGSTHSPTPPREDGHKTGNTTALTSSSATTPASVLQSTTTPPSEREPSPELARISPLVTRPPKHKLNAGKLKAALMRLANVKKKTFSRPLL